MTDTALSIASISNTQRGELHRYFSLLSNKISIPWIWDNNPLMRTVT